MNTQPAKLLGLHLFYRNDVREGFGVGLDQDFFADNPEAQHNFIKCSQLSINEYKKQKNDKERKRFIADIQSRFNEACVWMNKNKTQPLNEDWLAFFVILLDDMTFLQNVGLLPDDDFNGPMWAWLKDNDNVKEEIIC